ncbi:MAG: hypothetical protein ACO31Z_06860 [Litorivicinaceae bacterium]
MRHPLAWVMCVALASGVFGLGWELRDFAQAGAAWRVFVAEPALGAVWGLSTWVAVASTVLSVSCAKVLTAWLWQRPHRLWLPGLLAVPHSAVALGLLWLLVPSGVIVRWLAWPLGWMSPPDWTFPQDPWGVGLILALTLKETVFLTVMAMAVLVQLPVQGQVLHATSLGWSSPRIFRQCVWPQVLSQLRAPILIILAFGLTNLELTLILAPDIPGLIGPRLIALLTDADPIRRAAGAVGALLLLCVTFALSLACLGLMRGLAWWRRLNVELPRPSQITWLGHQGLVCVGGLLWCAIGVSLVLWAVAGPWSFQMPFPVMDWDRLGLRLLRMVTAIRETTAMGLATALSAVIGAVWVLESMAQRHQRRVPLFWWGVLWVPALPLSAGLLSVWLMIGGQPGFWAVLFAHWLIACPYALIVLSGPWLARPSWERSVIQMSGLGPWRALRQVWVPKHRAALWLAFAVAFSVSCALYTQTLMLGGGRVETLATELVVSLQSDRRLAAVAGVANTILPAVLFVVASLLAGGRRSHV